MAVDFAHEDLIPLDAAGKLVPGRKRCGVHRATVWRWHLRGVRGIKLETLLIGGLRYTSQQALARFFAATTARADGTPAVATPRTFAQCQRAHATAMKYLAEEGI